MLLPIATKKMLGTIFQVPLINVSTDNLKFSRRSSIEGEDRDFTLTLFYFFSRKTIIDRKILLTVALSSLVGKILAFFFGERGFLKKKGK